MEGYDEDNKAYDWTKEPEGKADDIGDGDTDSDARRRLETQAAFDNLRERMARADLAVPEPLRKFPTDDVPQEPLIRPTGDAAQLREHRLASCAATIGHLAGYIARNDTSPNTRMSFMDSMSSMIGASAKIGKVVGRLRGNFSETRQMITVKKEMTGAGGVLES